MSQVDGQGHTDVAALSAGVIAVAVSLFVVPGPFGIIGSLVSISVMCLIFGYVWQNPRTRWQSIAVASLLGLVAIPFFGFVIDLASAQNPSTFFVTSDPGRCPTGAEWRACKAAQPTSASSINNIWELSIWFVVALITMIVDRLRQRKL